ncbi:hypothetical protein CROQUDRAFT_723775 [Cronartium quercuum f. sp. fusiforme G11]|uniref:Carrier domain-containing protein n=1 Tax=Cronartium quercuum f. sp. fusiforme G11 TaxID=708437 RepID=A0A9P6NDS0_9BASI|nr:hypothetical protein CROQUDRAFT_723775 [Cronartium quercuum f. sp. fusiforme G11]
MPVTSPFTYQKTLQTSSPVFKTPDLASRDLTPTKLIDFHLLNNSKYPFGVLAGSTKSNLENDVITWNEVGSALVKVTQDLNHLLIDTSTSPVIGIIASCDPLVYFTTLLGIMRAGCVPFAISPRNSAAAIVRLIKSTGCQALYVQFDPTLPSQDFEKISFVEKSSRKQITEVLESGELQHIQLLELPSADMLFPRLIDGSAYTFNSDLPQQLASMVTPNQPDYAVPVMILHSSGTTNFPKPIHINTFTFQGWMNSNRYFQFSWTGEVIAAMVLPAFHVMGINLGLFTILSDGAISGFFRPEIGPHGHSMIKSPNSVNVIEAMRSLGCTVAAFSPMMLAEFASDPSSVEFLKTLKRVGFGGGPLTVEIGNQLIKAGVQLSVMFGSTEVGTIATQFPKRCLGVNWEYFEISSQLTTRLVPHGENLYELVILSSDRHRCSLAHRFDDFAPQTYHTNDLLSKHPTLPLYRIVGRKDDQIILSNSEKTNPGPLEAILAFNPAIKGALMFGRGKPQNGVLIEPGDSYTVDVTDREAVGNYINLIWPSIEEVNRFAPTHSRLTRELILVIDPRVKPLPKTNKGQVARVKTLEMFSDEIEAIYVRDQLSTESGNVIIDSNGEVVWERVLENVREIVKAISSLDLKDEEDFFVEGCDSITAMQIRSKITQLVITTSSKDVTVPQNLVYQHASISRLSAWTFGILSRRKRPNELETQDAQCAPLSSMIKKYSPITTIRTHQTAAPLPVPNKAVVIRLNHSGLKIRESEVSRCRFKLSSVSTERFPARQQKVSATLT